MRISWPYTLTREDADRLLAVLARRGGCLSLRDLERRHRFWPYMVEAAETAGLVRIETRKAHTGRPSRVAVSDDHSVNKTTPAKLPRRRDVSRGLTVREEHFLMHYSCRRGCSFFGGGRGAGSAADAYRKSYGRHRRLTPGGSRSGGARLMRQPWMRAAFLLDRRLMAHGRRLHYPDDMRSAGSQWRELIRLLDRAFVDWPADVGRVIRDARTIADAGERLLSLERFRS